MMFFELALEEVIKKKLETKVVPFDVTLSILINRRTTSMSHYYFDITPNYFP